MQKLSANTTKRIMLDGLFYSVSNALGFLSIRVVTKRSFFLLAMKIN